MFKRLHFLTVFAFFAINANAQLIPAEHKSAIKRHVAKAEKSFLAKDYANAVLEFKLVDSLAPGIPEVECNIGICYLNSRYKSHSLPYFEKAKTHGYSLNDIYFYLGRAYHYNYKFDKAKASFQQYLKEIAPDTLNVIAKPQEVKRKIEICDNAIEHVEDSLFVTIENIGPAINSNFDEYVPIVSADEKILYFTSRRPSDFNLDIFKDGKHYEDIHYSIKDEKGNWMPAKVADYPLNLPDHDACIGLSADSKTIFLFRATKDNPALGSIYQSKFDGTKWSEPTKLGSNINTSKGWESSITLSEDNKRLYFSSDRPGGFGGFDIWYCDLIGNNLWSEPKNVGPSINTKYNEDCPFIHYDNVTLFFSSDGHNTMGGFDVFSSVYFKDKDKWTKPINIGYPINSVDDDMYFTYSSDGSKGYLSSTMKKDSKGGNDIYVINRPYHSHRILTLRGKLLNSETNLPIGATITVTDLATNQIIGIFKADSITGRYLIQIEKGKNYAMQFEANGMIIGSENIDMNDPEYIFAEKKMFGLKSIKKGNTIALKNIFFDYDNYDLKNESFNELSKLTDFLKENSKIRIQINGYSDTVGNQQYNLRLSKKRANEVRNHLTNNGIKGNRIRIQGFGEATPKTIDTTDKNLQASRYTEFQIYDLDTLSADKKSNFTKEDSVVYEDVLLEGIVDEKKVGAVLIPYVVFNFNDGKELNLLSRKHLHQIVAVMKRLPKMKLNILGNTELVGKEYNNKTLFEARVKTVSDFLIQQGIGQERLKSLEFVSTKAKKQAKLPKGKEDGRSVKFSLLEF